MSIHADGTDNLRLCLKHKQEWKQSHYDSCNCDYCKLLKEKELQTEAVEAFAKRIVGIEHFNNSPCQAHSLETVELWLQDKFNRDKQQRDELLATKPSESVLQTIGVLLADAMNFAVSNGANSVSMPDEYVELAVWLEAIAKAGESSQVDRVVRLPNELTPQLAKAILVQHTLDDQDWSIASEAWDLIREVLINPEHEDEKAGEA